MRIKTAFRFAFFSVFFHILALLTVFPAVSQEDTRAYDRENVINGISAAGSPFVKNGFVVFTAQSNTRYTGIAFDFEDFQKIHNFSRLIQRDENNEPSGSVYFYILDVPDMPPEISSISYRLIIDGLWTLDPLNPQKNYSIEAGGYLSTLKLNRETKPVTEKTKSGTVRFVYQGESGARIRLAGTFTNWDPFIYELSETAPGFYEIDVYLLPGSYYYNFYRGITPVTDSTNPNRGYTKDGRTASLITVK
ncbi:MAG: hypothetical protein Ta2A_06200 [Treponemataceae bacterium]|nr:MAG: hypothetical protein Ta2A_06200 [Treponemataceae bacterium]